MFGAQVFARLEWLHFVLEIREQQLAFGFGQLEISSPAFVTNVLPRA